MIILKIIIKTIQKSRKGNNNMETNNYSVNQSNNIINLINEKVKVTSEIEENFEQYIKCDKCRKLVDTGIKQQNIQYQNYGKSINPKKYRRFK